MNLIRTSFYTTLSTAVIFINGFILLKVVAIKIGPKGIAFVGQFQNTTTILTLIATAAISMGVVKYLAQHRTEPDQLKSIINTAFVCAFISSAIISVVVVASSAYLSNKVFRSDEFAIVYVLYGLFLMAVSFNVIFSAILNGLKEIRKFTFANITASVLTTIFTLLGAYYFGIKGVLLSSTATALIMFITYIFIFNNLKIKWTPNFRRADKKIIRILSAYSLMALVTGFVTPFVQIFIRDKILSDFSINDAGYWQAVTKISDYYLAFIIAVLSVYYMPRLSEIQEKKELRAEIIYGYKIILPVAAVLCFMIWIFKDLVIQLLFTPEFLPMKPLFTFQLLGDFFKIGSWLLAYTMIAKAMTKTFLITEIAFSLSFLILSYIFIENFGVIGATYSFCLNYGIYWIVMYCIIARYLKKKGDKLNKRH